MFLMETLWPGHSASRIHTLVSAPWNLNIGCRFTGQSFGSADAAAQRCGEFGFGQQMLPFIFMKRNKISFFPSVTQENSPSV